MRRISFAVRVFAIVAIFAVSVVGQQKAVLLYPSTAIDLAVEPARAVRMMTLADAARHNDFPTFDALYSVAPSRDASAYRELHSFWKWSLADPIGGFYGDEMHTKLASEYPDYADYIADFGIIDARGNAYYPSAETRAFLLKKAESGRVALVAETVRPDTRRVGQPPSPLHAKHVAVAKKKPVHVAAVKAPKAKPVVIAQAEPVLVTKVVEQPKPQVVVQTTPQAGQAGASVLHSASRPAPAVKPAADARLGRGLMLIIAGLIALGMLSMMFSASGDEEPAREEKPLEPMRIIPMDEKPKKTA